jgi:hypothetical protein
VVPKKKLKLKQEVLNRASKAPKLTAHLVHQHGVLFKKYPEASSLFVLSALNDISK